MKRYIYLIFATLLFAGCEDYLDKVEDKEVMTPEDVFTEYDKFRRYADKMYDLIFDEDRKGISSDGGTNSKKVYDHSSGMCDECQWGVGKDNNSWLLGNYETRVNGSARTNGSVNAWYPWELSWDGIRIANDVLINLDRLEDASEEQIDQLRGQAYFMRAQYYFVLIRRWGGMPYFKEPLNINDGLAYERLSYEETMNEIVADCDNAFKFLPHKWDDDNVGRVTKGAALMLKSRALLYDASPRFNQANDISRWEIAAQAAWDMIDYANQGHYRLIQCPEAADLDIATLDGSDYLTGEPEKLKAYREIFLYNAINDEVIFNQYRKPRACNDEVYPIWLCAPKPMSHKYTACLSPTQNLVDMFETKDGYPIDHPASGYNPQNPYVNRDPRFYNNILFDGVKWPNKDAANKDEVELFSKGKNGKVGEDRWRGDEKKIQRSKTGYLIRKIWPINIHAGNKSQKFYANKIFYRLAEAYLNFAEAANEAYGPQGAVPGASMTALDAINALRNRVGMPDVKDDYIGSTDVFRPRIQNERSVELCFEGSHRWFDIRRWNILTNPEISNIRIMDLFWEGVSDTYPTGYRFEEKENAYVRIFEEKHYLYPIPKKDSEIFLEFIQNPGW